MHILRNLEFCFIKLKFLFTDSNKIITLKKTVVEASF